MSARARIGWAILLCGSAVVLSAVALAGSILAIGGPSKDRPPYWFETVMLCLVRRGW